MRALLLLLLLYCSGINAQEGKGISVPEQSAGARGQSRALLIGISKYQQVDSLRYADRDAQEFAQFLQQNADWKVPSSNIQLLTNERAKAGDILAGLAWLEETSKPGDQVIFFFSGHGDVETKADSSKGYLLAHDSPRNNYLTGAIPVTLLQRVFSEMITKGIRVFLVTDACRSGHLAGGEQGVKLTAQAFGNQWRSEIKYLSAQPHELSYEDSVWGGGRGVFSFYLMKGLNGYADLNQDSIVSQFELQQYVGPQVAIATKGKQQPVFMGPDMYTRTVSHVDQREMERYARWGGDRGIAVVVTPGALGKGQEYVDSSCSAYISLMHQLDTLRLDSSASFLALKQYQAAASCRPETRMRARLRLTAVFLNSIQEVVNQSLMGRELITIGQQQTALHRLNMLLEINAGKALPNFEHLHNIRRYLTVNQLSLLEHEDYDTFLLRYPVRSLIDSALEQEPAAPYLLHAKAVYQFYGGDALFDSVIYNCKKALERSPTWMMPMLLIGMSYENLEQPDSALYWYQKVETLDSAYRQYECAICFYTRLGDLFLKNEQWEHAARAFHKTLSYRSDYDRGWGGLATAYFKLGDRKKAALYIGKIDSAEKNDLEARLETLQWLLEDRLIGLEDARIRMALIRNYSTERAGDSTISTEDYKKILQMDSVQTPLMEYTEALIAQTFKLSNWKGKLREAMETATGTPLETDVTFTYIQALWDERGSAARLAEVYELVKTMEQKFAAKLSFRQTMILQLLEATCLLLTDENDEIRFSFRKGSPLSDKQREGLLLLQKLTKRRPAVCEEFMPTLRSLPDQKDETLQALYRQCGKAK